MNACIISPTGVAFGLVRKTESDVPNRLRPELLQVAAPCRRSALWREPVNGRRHRYRAPSALKPKSLLCFTHRVS